jgi:autotransporter-associated beta strand protein
MADDGTGNGTYKVASVTVTTPGVNYTSADVSFLKGGATAVAPAASATLGTTAPAGLTKLGLGTLTLSGTNTYAGATTISNGTVRLGIANALPDNAAVIVDGGTYDLGGFSVTNGSTSLIRGAVISGTLNNELTKVGDGIATALLYSTSSPITISGGTLLLPGVQPGVYEGRILNNAFDQGSENPRTAIKLSVTNAFQYYASSAASGGIWPDNTTYIYNGYLWNRSTTNEVWTFCKRFDDSVSLIIDATSVINNTGSGDTITRNYIMTPGPHAIEVRLGQGGGAVGPGGGYPGVGFDRLGRNTANAAYFQRLADPGDGSLLTLSASSTNLSSVTIAASATLDLGGAARVIENLDGSGTVSNGTLTVTGTISPAGTNDIDVLTAKANTTLSGKLLVNVATDGTSDCLDVQGNLDLSSSPTLEIVDLMGLNPRKMYTLITYSGTLSGSLTLPGILNNTLWALRTTPDGAKMKMQLYYRGGTLIRVM